MVSEAVHSLTDTLNQAVLLYGYRESKRAPNVEHPYGYKSMKHITSLISGVGIFCLGAGVSIWHGITERDFKIVAGLFSNVFSSSTKQYAICKKIPK